MRILGAIATVLFVVALIVGLVKGTLVPGGYALWLVLGLVFVGASLAADHLVGNRVGRNP